MNEKLKQSKSRAIQELESLIGQCQREIRNLLRFDDNRMLVATADVKRHFDAVEQAADELESAFNEAIA